MFRYRLAITTACCTSTRTRWIAVAKKGKGGSSTKENGGVARSGATHRFLFLCAPQASRKRPRLLPRSNYDRPGDRTRWHVRHHRLDSRRIDPVGRIDYVNRYRLQRVQAFESL